MSTTLTIRFPRGGANLKATRRAILSASVLTEGQSAAPLPLWLSKTCPACHQPLARPGTLVKHYRWYHEECQPQKRKNND